MSNSQSFNPPVILNLLFSKLCRHIVVYIIYMYRLYTEVKVSTGFIKPRAEGTRFDKSVETVPRCITDFYHWRAFCIVTMLTCACK